MPTLAVGSVVYLVYFSLWANSALCIYIRPTYHKRYGLYSLHMCVSHNTIHKLIWSYVFAQHYVSLICFATKIMYLKGSNHSLCTECTARIVTRCVLGKQRDIITRFNEHTSEVKQSQIYDAQLCTSNHEKTS